MSLRVVALTTVILAVLTACSHAPETPEGIAEPVPVAEDPFPSPPGLQPNVDFWRDVYATWSRGQTVLHDDRYMNVVYRVLDLPGDSGLDLGYSPVQRDFVRGETAYLHEQLASLERKFTAGLPVTATEQRLAELITTTTGSAEAIIGASERLRSQRGLKERFRRGVAISGRYDTLFRQIYREMGLPEDIALLPHVESSFQGHARSSAGAVGMFQFTKGAAKIYMRNHPALDERLDPLTAARGAGNYLKDAYDRLGDWALAMTSYNHGIYGMKRARREFGTDFDAIVRYYQGPYFKFASRNFYAQFLAAKEVVHNLDRYFPDGVDFEPPLDWDRVVLRVPVTSSELAQHYAVRPPTLHLMNPSWTGAATQDRLTLPVGTHVWLPPGTLVRLAKRGMDDIHIAMTGHERTTTTTE